VRGNALKSGRSAPCLKCGREWCLEEEFPRCVGVRGQNPTSEDPKSEGNPKSETRTARPTVLRVRISAFGFPRGGGSIRANATLDSGLRLCASLDDTVPSRGIAQVSRDHTLTRRRRSNKHTGPRPRPRIHNHPTHSTPERKPRPRVAARAQLPAADPLPPTRTAAAGHKPAPHNQMPTHPVRLHLQ